MTAVSQMRESPVQESVADQSVKKISALQDFFVKLNNDWSLIFAGALAYSLLTAIAPILIAMAAILGFILGPSQIQAILQTTMKVLPALSSQRDVINHGLGQLANQAGFLALIAVLLALFGGSRLFIGLEGCLDIIYRVRPRTVIRQNVMAFVMLLLFIILVPIMIFAATLPSFLLQFIAAVPAIKTLPFLTLIANNPLTISLTGAAGGLLAAFIFFFAIYIIVPNQRITWRHSWLGAIIAAIALQLFITFIFPFYTIHFMGNYVGQAGFAVILLVFFYYFAFILILGSEINAFCLEKVRPLPNDLATFVSTMGGKLNQDIPESEAPSHVNPQPTDQADRAHIATTRKHETANQAENLEKQGQITAKKRPKTTKIPKKHRAEEPIFPTALAVILGSIFTIAIELIRQHGQRT